MYFHSSYLVFWKCASYFPLLFSSVWFSATPWSVACQASLSFIIFWNLVKLMSIESMMPSNHLILCHPLLLLLSIFPSIRDFSNELCVHIRWPNYCSFSFSISFWSLVKTKVRVSPTFFNWLWEKLHSWIYTPDPYWFTRNKVRLNLMNFLFIWYGMLLHFW